MRVSLLVTNLDHAAHAAYNGLLQGLIENRGIAVVHSKPRMALPLSVVCVKPGLS